MLHERGLLRVLRAHCECAHTKPPASKRSASQQQHTNRARLLCTHTSPFSTFKGKSPRMAAATGATTSTSATTLSKDGTKPASAAMTVSESEQSRSHAAFAVFVPELCPIVGQPWLSLLSTIALAKPSCHCSVIAAGVMPITPAEQWQIRRAWRLQGFGRYCGPLWRSIGGSQPPKNAAMYD